MAGRLHSQGDVVSARSTRQHLSQEDLLGRKDLHDWMTGFFKMIFFCRMTWRQVDNGCLVGDGKGFFMPDFGLGKWIMATWLVNL